MLALLTLTFTLSASAGESSEPAPLAVQSLLLDVARAGNRLVTVGDRGHVLLSDDEGRTWRQVVVPTRAMLTGVSFGDATHGWAVGHDGVILATIDGGNTWTRQDPGNDLETVFLDVHFLDSVRGFAVGAYGKCLTTSDAGKTWSSLAPTADELHYNQITAGPDGMLYLAGESGMLLASRDSGLVWSRLEVPYDGSLYGALCVNDRELFVHGLRGSVYFTADAGESWTRRETGVPVLIMAGLRMKSGVIVFAGTGGNFLISRDGGVTFAHWQPESYRGGVSALLETADDALLVVGENGAARLTLP
jgi:photosystem II stability/assembly factor-like uncharacterized protein